MTMVSLFHAILLGAVEGLTEFIPVSSTGHLLLLIDILRIAPFPGRTFEIVIQLGAITAVCFLYRKKLLHVVYTFPTQSTSRHFIFIVCIGFLPAAIFGAVFHSYIKAFLFSPWVVAISLVIGGILMLLIERLKPASHIDTIDRITYQKALAIGVIQCVAMIPGTSRAGATIMGSLMLGINRSTATEFSFFLAIPTMFGATTYDIYKNYHLLTLSDIQIIAVGFLIAFITALLVVKHVIAFVSRHGFAPFAWYRILFGTSMLMLLLYLR